MSFEDRIASIDTTLQAILASLQSGAQVAASVVAAPAAEVTTEKKTRAKKTEAVVEPTTAVVETPAVVTQSAPAASSTTSETSAAEPTWQDVIKVLKTINTSSEPHLGRAALEALIAEFPLADGTKSKTVTGLEVLNKHGTILAYANKLIAGPAAEDDGNLF